jgi:hypothetical protein
VAPSGSLIQLDPLQVVGEHPEAISVAAAALGLPARVERTCGSLPTLDLEARFVLGLNPPRLPPRLHAENVYI